MKAVSGSSLIGRGLIEATIKVHPLETLNLCKMYAWKLNLNSTTFGKAKTMLYLLFETLKVM